jgi:hypothetical protein
MQGSAHGAVRHHRVNLALNVSLLLATSDRGVDGLEAVTHT